MTTVEDAVRSGAGREEAAETLGLSVRTLQRWQEQGPESDDQRCGPQGDPPNKLSATERQQVLDLVNRPEYRDLSPNQIVPRALDEKSLYVASESTIYRVLREEGQMTHREPSRPATGHRPDEHVATGPNQIWSWDITWLPGPIRGTFFYLYLIMDVWSRKIVAGTVYAEESALLASHLFHSTCQRLGLDPDGLVLHSDNGGPMKGATMLATLNRLGVVASFSRPRVSDDNPFSEALFRTMKYRPEYPSRPFPSLEQAQAWVDEFTQWYNTEHRHSAIRYVTPDERHNREEADILDNRHRIYEEARRRHPERWSGETRDWSPVATVSLNPERKVEVEDAA